MKSRHLFKVGRLGIVHFHRFSQIVAVNERVGHFDTFGFHRVFLAELVFSDFLIVEVTNFT